jgi:hypothetical protein
MSLEIILNNEYSKKLRTTASLCERVLKDFPEGHSYQASLLTSTIQESLGEILSYQSTLEGVQTSEDIIRQLSQFHVNLAKENEGKFKDPKSMTALLNSIKNTTEKLADNENKTTE